MAITTELLLAHHGEAVCNVAGIVGGDRSSTAEPVTQHGSHDHASDDPRQ